VSFAGSQAGSRSRRSRAATTALSMPRQQWPARTMAILRARVVLPTPPYLQKALAGRVSIQGRARHAKSPRHVPHRQLFRLQKAIDCLEVFGLESARMLSPSARGSSRRAIGVGGLIDFLQRRNYTERSGTPPDILAPQYMVPCPFRSRK
jgi:hypothetical protein